MTFSLNAKYSPKSNRGDELVENLFRKLAAMPMFMHIAAETLEAMAGWLRVVQHTRRRSSVSSK